jgi:hypothetical protein
MATPFITHALNDLLGLLEIVLGHEIVNSIVPARLHQLAYQVFIVVGHFFNSL